MCPSCKNGLLIPYDHCDRKVCYEGGDSEWIKIPRHKCDNPACRRIHRMLPCWITPFKHYSEEVISDSLDGEIEPQESDDRPSEQTVKRWKEWLDMNARNINGHLRSIGYRELGFSRELLESSVPLLEKLRSSMPGRWLRAVIRFIYNSGAFLCPFYD